MMKKFQFWKKLSPLNIDNFTFGSNMKQVKVVCITSGSQKNSTLHTVGCVGSVWTSNTSWLHYRVCEKFENKQKLGQQLTTISD